MCGKGIWGRDAKTIIRSYTQSSIALGLGHREHRKSTKLTWFGVDIEKCHVYNPIDWPSLASLSDFKEDGEYHDQDTEIAEIGKQGESEEFGEKDLRRAK